MGCEKGTIVKRREIEVSLGVICVYIPLPVNHSPSFRPSPPSLRLNFTPWTVHRPGADRARHYISGPCAGVLSHSCVQRTDVSASYCLVHLCVCSRPRSMSPMCVFVTCHIAHTKPSRYHSLLTPKTTHPHLHARVSSSSSPPICTSALTSPILVPAYGRSSNTRRPRFAAWTRLHSILQGIARGVSWHARARTLLAGWFNSHLVHAYVLAWPPRPSSIVRFSTRVIYSAHCISALLSCHSFVFYIRPHRSTYHIPAHIAVWTGPDFPPCRRVHTAPRVHSHAHARVYPVTVGSYVSSSTRACGVSPSHPLRIFHVRTSLLPLYRFFSLDHSLASPAQITFSIVPQRRQGAARIRSRGRAIAHRQTNPTC